MTHEDLFGEVLKLHQTLLNIQHSLVRLEALPEVIKDHEERLRNLETFTNKARGGLLLSAAAGGAISGVVVALMQALL